MRDLISRQEAIAVADFTDYRGLTVEDVKKVTDEVVKGLKQLPSAQPTLYGYNVKHLELIARILQKENVSPERVVEALTDIGRIVPIVCDEICKALGDLSSAQPGLTRCKDCKHRYVDGKNVRFNVCELNYNKVQSDDWFCADAERKDDETE